MPQRQPEGEPPGTLRPREVREAPPSSDEAAPSTRTRNILIGVVLVAIVLLVVLLRRHTASTAKQAQAAAAGAKNRAVPVAVTAVVSKDMPVYIDGLGNLNALNTVTLKTSIGGQLSRFHFQERQSALPAHE